MLLAVSSTKNLNSSQRRGSFKSNRSGSMRPTMILKKLLEGDE